MFFFVEPLNYKLLIYSLCSYVCPKCNRGDMNSVGLSLQRFYAFYCLSVCSAILDILMDVAILVLFILSRIWPPCSFAALGIHLCSSFKFKLKLLTRLSQPFKSYTTKKSRNKVQFPLK